MNKCKSENTHPHLYSDQLSRFLPCNVLTNDLGESNEKFCTFIFFLAISLPSFVVAAPFTTTINGSTFGLGAATCSFDQSGTSPLGDSCGSILVAPNANSAISKVGAGYLQVSASVTAYAPEGIVAGSSRASASFSDTLSFFAPTLANQTATFRGALIVEGKLSTAAIASHVGDGAGISGANASWQVGGGIMGAGFIGQGVSENYSDNRNTFPSNLNGFVFPTFATLSFDSAGHATGIFSVSAIVNASANAAGFRKTSLDPFEPGQADAGALFANTIYWGGIDEFSVNGNPFLGNYTVSSSSGANYRFSTKPTSPVPEPATYAMMIAGLIAITCRRRMLNRLG